MKLLGFAVLLFVATGLSPWLRYSLSAQTAEENSASNLIEAHPKLPELMRHFKAYQAANERSDYDTAVREAEILLSLTIEIVGETDQLTATWYGNVGSAWLRKSEYDKAIGYFEKALKIGSKTSGEDHPGAPTWYNSLGVAWDSKGEYDKAISYYEKALKVGLKALGEEHPDVATWYNNIGSAWNSKGEYDKAIGYYEKALKIDLKVLGKEHPDVATRYNNLGEVWNRKGEYDKAIDYAEKALKIGLKTLGKEHPNVAMMYNNLGGAWDSKGEYNKAIGYYEKALKIDLKVLGEEHPDVAITYNNLGNAWDSKGEYDKAISYYEKALKVGLKVLGEEHSIIATLYNSLGAAWNNKRVYDKAVSYFEKATKMLQNGQNRDQYLNSLRNLAFLSLKANKLEIASEHYTKLIQKILKYRFELSGEKSAFTARYVQYFDDALYLELFQNNNAKAFEYDSLRRGLSLAEALSLKDALAQGGVTPTEQKQMLDLASEIESLRAQQAAALNRGKKDKADELLQRIFVREKQKDELDQKLARAYPKYGEIRFPKAPSVESIQKNLRDDEIFISYLISTEKSLAFVVDKKKGLRVVNLSLDTISPEKKSLRGGDSKINRWAGSHALKISNYQTLYTGDTRANILPIPTKDGVIYWNSGAQEGKYDIDKDFNVTTILRRRDRGMHSELADKAQFEKIAIGKAGDALTPEQIKGEREKLRLEIYNTFVAPIQEEYPGAKKWVVSPDGALYYLPFHLLSSDKLKMPEITLAHSAVVWQKLRGGERKAAPKTLLAFGNAIYGSGHSDVRSPIRGQRRAAAGNSEKRIGKMRIYGSQDTAELKWDNLSGTGEEVKGIATLAYSYGKDKEANVHTGVAANVDRVLSLKDQKRLGDYKYIHFAVHGLFVDGNPALNALVMTLPDKAKQHKADEYNTYIKTQPLKADGYLRAGDISALNLNAELVVMSACETSLGHEVGGEGMVALPQSFLTAGARSVVASLWSVDDAATSLFMQRFYKYLLTDKKKPKEALAATQRDFREHKEFQQYRDPFYWAAFVIYGE